jgi:hypothetical protein
MVKYRSRLKIVADMLSVASGDDAKKTRIMYLANLSWDLLNRYLDERITIQAVTCLRGRGSCSSTGSVSIPSVVKRLMST